MARLETHAGAMETPSPAAIKRTAVGHCGVSCTILGRNPSASQHAIMRSKAKDPIFLA
jgi:hypothetical protein